MKVKLNMRNELSAILRSAESPIIAQALLQRLARHQSQEFTFNVVYRGEQRTANLVSMRPDRKPDETKVTILAPAGSALPYHDPFDGCVCDWCKN